MCIQFPCNSTYLDNGDCNEVHVHQQRRYSDPSVAWVLTAAIIVFFMVKKFLHEIVCTYILVLLESWFYVIRNSFCHDAT